MGETPEGRAPEGHPRGRDDHPLPPRPASPTSAAARTSSAPAQIGAVKLLESSGVYCKGDESNERLQRIYGTAFASQKELEEHLERLEEARARDHRRLGQELDLFSFNPLAPASPFFHPEGRVRLQRAWSTTCASSTPATATAR